MIKFKSALLVGTLSTLVLLSGCGTADEVASEADASVSEAATARATKAEMLADFEATISTAQETQGPGTPALWQMQDDDTTIYLFGTVHILRPEVEWRSPVFETAFASADTIVFEVDLTSEEAQSAIMKDLVSRGFYDDGRTLRSVLDDEVEAVVETALDSVGLPLDAVNAMEPWMTATNLSTMKLQADGYDPSSGVEAILGAEAKTAGKAFSYLETISDQADAFDLLPEEDQITALYETALMLDESPDMLDQLVEEWADGDVEGLTALVADPEGLGNGEAFYQAVLVDRNEKWVPKIEALLDEPGTVLIAVGAGHLVGQDSVIAMLRNAGYTIDRL